MATTTTREISVDVNQLNRFAAIVAKQYDRESRFLKVHILDNGEEIAVDSTATITINALRADETAKSFYGSVNGDGTVTVPLTYWMLELDDTVECDISIIVGDEVVLKTTLFELEVQHAAVSNEAVEEDEDYDVLVELIKKVDSYAEIEAERDTAEAARTKAESGRVSAENARVTAEKARVTAEAARETAETERQTQESTRQTNEKARSTAETARATAETARANAESARVQAENARVTAEAARETASEQAVTNVENALAALEVVTAPLTITDEDNAKTYQATIAVKGGKPFLVYEEVTTETT